MGDAITSQRASVQIYSYTFYFHLVFNLKAATTTPGRSRSKMLNNKHCHGSIAKQETLAESAELNEL